MKDTCITCSELKEVCCDSGHIDDGGPGKHNEPQCVDCCSRPHRHKPLFDPENNYVVVVDSGVYGPFATEELAKAAATKAEKAWGWASMVATLRDAAELLSLPSSTVPKRPYQDGRRVFGGK